MKFSEIVTQASALLQRKGRITYRALQREFALDEAALADLRDELIDGEQVARDEQGKVLVWAGTPSGQRVGYGEQTPAEEVAFSLPMPAALSVEAERRQLTVMFCDVVGSTALSTQLDPEEYREVMQAYQHACVAVLSRFGGYVGQYLGDGLLVYFGYPAAHEDDATRAVRAGLGIVAAIQALTLPPHLQLPSPLQVRVGIHTGLVVVGEIGSGEYRAAHAIMGETPNIAARLQDQALPNSVVISPTTARLITGLFECQELGPQTLKGIATPLTVYRVIQESEARSRFEVAVSAGLPPLVGREEELRVLRHRWTQAQEGAGQVVLLSGEPGIGKSRLVQALKEHLARDEVTRIEFRCSPYHQNSALYPIITHLQRLLQFTREDPPAAKLAKLQRVLGHYRFPQADTAPLLAVLLSLPHPEGCPPLTVSPQKQKERTQAALVAWLREEAERRPVYTVWEDLHWADPSTLEVLTLFLDQVPTTRLLVLLTTRPEFASPWGSRSYLTPLTLTRLGRVQVEAMIEQVVGQPLPAEVVEQIRLKTDGVPLFVEELTKNVVESGLLTAVDDHYELRGPLPPLAIPATLQDSLMARLDRLSTVREIAQLGATIGREFSYELLQAVSHRDEATLQQGLKQLVEAELVYQRGLPPQAHYLFKHALIRDVAYQSLLKSTRQRYHQQIAQRLAEQSLETQETQPELLAHHYTEAGLLAQATPYWQRAGERATQHSAYVEAVAHLTRGLEGLKALPETPERVQHELTLQLALGAALLPSKGYTAAEVEKTATRARELCQQLGETPQLFPVLGRLMYFYIMRGDLRTARELAAQQMRLAQRVHDRDLLALAHGALGGTLFFLGELPAARAHLEQALALYDPQTHQHSTFNTADPRVDWLSFVAWTVSLLGYPDQALKRSQEAMAVAAGLSHSFSLTYALDCVAWFHLLRREGPLARARAEAMMALASEQGFPHFVAEGMFLRGWALVEEGQKEEGVVQIRQGLAAVRAMGSEVTRQHWLVLLAEACGKVGCTEEGLTLLAEALAAGHKSGQSMWEAELYRVKGELALQQLSVATRQVSGADPRPQTPDPQGQAEACLLQAIEIARRQQARSWELRATTSLARLWQQQGKPHEARTMLFDSYHWFTEGFDLKDLQEAKTLLAELAEDR